MRHSQRYRGAYTEAPGWGGKLGEPATMAPGIRGRKRRVATEGGGICGVACEQ